MQGARLKFRGCPLTRPDANREQGAKMKFSGFLRFAMFCFALTLAASGFAADTLADAIAQERKNLELDARHVLQDLADFI